MTRDMIRNMTINIARNKQGRRFDIASTSVRRSFDVASLLLRRCSRVALGLLRLSFGNISAMPRLSLGDVSVQNNTSKHNVSMMFRRVLLLVLMMTFGINVSWGQAAITEGVYYIASHSKQNPQYSQNAATNYYLVPADDPQQTHKADAFFNNQYVNDNSATGDYTDDNYGDPGQPFLATYKTNKDKAERPSGESHHFENNWANNSVWVLKSTGDTDGSFYIIHATSGKYVVYEPPYKKATNRKSMHLLTTNNPGSNAKFVISDEINTTTHQRSIRVASLKNGNRFFSVNTANSDNYYGTGDNDYFRNGLVGLYSDASNDGNVQWHFDDATFAAPTISVDVTAGTFSLSATYIPTGCEIRYTTGDGTQDAPTANTGTVVSNSTAVSVPANGFTHVKAAIVGYGLVLSEVADVQVKCTTPIISYDNLTTVTITPTTENSTIYYSIGTNETPPGDPSTLLEGTTITASSGIIKAVAKKEGLIDSDIVTYTVLYECAAPSIGITYDNGEATVTITNNDQNGASIYYTQDGNDPTDGSTLYTGPITVTSVDMMTIKAIAAKTGCNSSSVVTETVAQVETPVITKENNTITITCATEGATIYYKIGSGDPVVYSTALGLSDNVSGRAITAYAMKLDMVKSANAVATTSDTKLKLPAPTISIFETPNNNVQFAISETISDEVVYKYTLDGNDPTNSTTTCTGFFTLTAPAIINVIATSDFYESSVVATSSSYVIPTNTSVLIQNQGTGKPFYYLIPNLKVGEDAYPKNLTTLNVPCNTMVWKFENAADNDGQYYYIKNSQGGYLYYTATDNTDKYVYFNAGKDTSDDGYKFKITHHSSGGFNIIPKGQTLSINKPNLAATGKDADATKLSPVKLAGAVGDTYSRWEILPYTSTASLPQWTNEPFKVWDNDNKKFYQIKSVPVTAKSLILANDGSIKTEEVSSTDPNYDIRKSIWVAKKVGSDAAGMLDYYTFQNTYTGELLYYNGKGRGVKDNPPVLQMGLPTVAEANEKWSHFVVVQTVSGYNIIPRDIVDNTKAISRDTGSNFEGFNCINRAGGNDSPGTWYDNDNGSRWTFVAYSGDVQCMPPVITYQDNKVRISTIHDNATIYYTTDGSDPNSSSTSFATNSTTLYTDISWNDGIIEVKAYVSKTGYTDSNIETYTPTFQAPVISYDAINDKIIITSSPGATVYYTTGETAADDPTETETQKYTSGSTGFVLADDINVIKAMAIKGAAVSDIVTLTIPVHAHTATNDRPYLIQSVQSSAFYMIPGDVDKGVTYVNTSSLGRPSMEWYFIGAGYDGGVTYYYIKNKATNEYVCYTSSVCLHTAETFDAAGDKSIYKFTITDANTLKNNGYYIHPVTNATATNGLSKKGNNNAADVVELADATNVNYTYARWKFILSADKPALSPQLRVWGSDGRKYYKIKKNNATDATATYLVPRTQTVSYAMVSVAADVSGPANSILWYFDVAYSDEWVTYYYVVNAATGEYLYFNGDETKSANDNALEAREELVAADNDRYLFAFAKTTSSTQYYFLPKVLQDQDLIKNSYSLVYWDGSSALTTAADRAANGGKWYLAEADVTDLCPPRLALDADGKVTLASRTRGATIKYEVGSEAEQTFDGTTTPIATMTEEGSQVVITTKTTVGEVTKTWPVTVVYKPTVTLAEQSVVYNGQMQTPELSSVMIGTDDITNYCVVSSNDFNAGDATAVITQKENNPFYDDPYYVIYGTAPFTIAKSPLTIYADSKMVEYGDAIPELSFSTLGLATIDEVHVSLECSATTSSELGTYPITFSDITSGVKYTITRHDGGTDASSNYDNVTLIPSSLIITAKSLGDGTQMAEGITAELTTDGEGITITAGTSTLSDENDYSIIKTTEGLYKDIIWTIIGEGHYTGSAELARVKSEYTNRDNEWRAGYVASHDWAIPEGSTIKAWIATYVDPALNVLRVKEINYLPEGVPAILTATDDKSGGVLVSPKSDDIADLTDAQKNGNLFKVVTDEGGMNVGATDTYKYVFHKGEMVLAFKGTLPKGTIYLDSGLNSPSAAGAPLHIEKDGEITGIIEINEDLDTKPVGDNWYSLDGRKLSGKPIQKGLYINKGRKIVVK